MVSSGKLVESYDRALDVLRADRAILDDLAHMLLEKEVVDRDELRTLTGRPAPDRKPSNAAD